MNRLEESHVPLTFNNQEVQQITNGAIEPDSFSTFFSASLSSSLMDSIIDAFDRLKLEIAQPFRALSHHFFSPQPAVSSITAVAAAHIGAPSLNHEGNAEDAAFVELESALAVIQNQAVLSFQPFYQEEADAREESLFSPHFNRLNQLHQLQSVRCYSNPEQALQLLSRISPLQRIAFLNQLEPHLRNDPHFMLQAILLDSQCFYFLGEDLKQDRCFAFMLKKGGIMGLLIALNLNQEIVGMAEAVALFSDYEAIYGDNEGEILFSDLSFLKKAVKIEPKVFTLIEPYLRNDLKLVKKLIQVNSAVRQFLIPEYSELELPAFIEGATD